MKYVGEAGPAWSIPKAERDMRGKREIANEPGPADYYIPGDIENTAFENLRNMHKAEQRKMNSPQKVQVQEDENMIPHMMATGGHVST